MKRRGQNIPLALLLALVVSPPAWANECLPRYADLSGRVRIVLAVTADSLAQLEGDPSFDFALLQHFPNPLASHPEWAAQGPELYQAMFKNLTDGLDLLAVPDRLKGIAETMRPLVRHYEHVQQALLAHSSYDLIARPVPRLRAALRQQLEWILKHPTAAHVPPLASFAGVGPAGKLTSLYETLARDSANKGAAVPFSRTDTKTFSANRVLPSPLINAPPEIVELTKRMPAQGLISSLDFTKFIAPYFSDPRIAAEVQIPVIVRAVRSRLAGSSPLVIDLNHRLKMGHVTDNDLAAYLAFHLPELMVQVQLFRSNQLSVLEKYIHPAAFMMGENRKALNAWFLHLKERDAEGWNMRNPEASRPVELALAYVRGEKKIEPAEPEEPFGPPRPPLIEATYESHEAPRLTIAEPETEDPTASVLERPRPAEPRPEPAAPVRPKLSFTSPAKHPLETWPNLDFKTSDTHAFGTAAEPLMFEHLDITSALISARGQFEAAEVKHERPALAQVEAYLLPKKRKPELLQPAKEAVKTLLELNTAKLAYLAELKNRSTALMGQMETGLGSLNGVKEQFPPVDGASAPELAKINAVLENLAALKGVATNTQSVDRNIHDLEAQILADRTILTGVVQVLGTPEVPGKNRESLFKKLAGLGRNGH